MRAAVVLAGALSVMALGQAAAGETRPRVAAGTICADQFVLALADRDQIVALSPDATSPWVSLMAEQAEGIPQMASSAERYLDAGVEVLVTDAWSDHQTAALLERFGVTVVRLPLVEDYDAVADVTRAVADAIGQTERGEALASAMRARLDAVASAPQGRDRAALYLRPGGGTAAAGSFVDTVMTTTGLRNQATQQGLVGWASTNLERFIVDPPEVLVTSFFDSPYPGLGQAFGAHPAFTSRAAGLERADVPGATWVCAGPILADAAEHLNKELAR
jgi:iron complex transport system substrate-binding protein